MVINYEKMKRIFGGYGEEGKGEKKVMEASQEPSKEEEILTQADFLAAVKEADPELAEQLIADERIAEYFELKKIKDEQWKDFNPKAEGVALEKLKEYLAFLKKYNAAFDYFNKIKKERTLE